MSTHFGVGAGIGVVSERLLVLLEPVNVELAERLWTSVSRGGGVDDVLEEISLVGLRTLGSFAMVQFEDQFVRLVLRGTATIVTESTDQEEVYTADGRRTWFEAVVPRAERIELRLASSDDVAAVGFRVQGGLVPAVVLRHSEVEAEVRASDVLGVDVRGAAAAFAVAPASQAEASMPDGVLLDDESVDEMPVTDGAVAPSLASEPLASESLPSAVAPAETPAETPPEPVQPDPVQPDPGRTLLPGDLAFLSAPELSAVPSDWPPAVAPGGAEPYDEYDEIYGLTVARSVQSAAVHSADDLGDDADHPAPIGLIDSIPAPPPSGTFRSDPALGDHDGRTMTKAQLAALRAGGAPVPTPAPAAMGGPSVQGLLCAVGHANPPQLQTCRVCRQPLSGAPIIMARPVLGQLRFSDGTVIALDVPLVIGRNPRLEGALRGEMPKVVRMDVGQGLSRTHATVRLEGWQVLLEDLNSANGTLVQLPGREARRLHPGEPILLEDGASVDFGGELTCTFRGI